MLEKMSKAREILQSWTDKLSPLFGMARVRVRVDFHDLFNRERDRVSFSTKDEIFINPQKILDLTEGFKSIIKTELLWVWASRNSVEPYSKPFVEKGRSVGISIVEATPVQEPKPEPIQEEVSELPYLDWCEPQNEGERFLQKALDGLVGIHWQGMPRIKAVSGPNPGYHGSFKNRKAHQQYIEIPSNLTTEEVVSNLKHFLEQAAADWKS